MASVFGVPIHEYCYLDVRCFHATTNALDTSPRLSVMHRTFRSQTGRNIQLKNGTVTISIVTFTTVIFTCLAMASPKQSSRNIWAGFVNDSGWSNKGVVFLTGLVNPNYGFGGLDASIHLAEDCINATTVVPLATIFSIVIGVITAFSFAVAMLYCISDVDSVLSTRTGQVFRVRKISSTY